MDNLLEEIKRINNLIGNTNSEFLNYLVEKTHNDLNYLIEEPEENPNVVTKETTKPDPFGEKRGTIVSFDFGKNPNYGKIFYIKEKTSFLKLPSPTGVDIQKIFGLYGKQYKKDGYGWYEEFEKPSWGTELVFDKETGEKSDKTIKVKRYFPTQNWSTFAWLYNNNIPFGLKAYNPEKGKYEIYTLIIKLIDPDKSVVPEEYPDDTSRGWTLMVPGMTGTNNQFDFGGAYYSVEDMSPYNFIAPRVESDVSTFNLDSRTSFDKFMDSGWGTLAQIGVSVAAALLTRGLALELAGPLVGVARLRAILVLTATLTEVGLNGYLANYYFNRGPEFESIGYICLAFIALPAISAYLPGARGLIGAEYSNKTLIDAISKKIAKKMAQVGSKQDFLRIIMQELDEEQKAFFLKFIEDVSNNPGLFKKAFDAYMDGKGANSFWAQSKKMITDIGELEIEQFRQSWQLTFKYIDELRIIQSQPSASFIQDFTLSIGAGFALQGLAIKIYSNFIQNKKEANNGKDPNFKKNDIKTQADNTKKGLTDYYNECPGYEKTFLKDDNQLATLFLEMKENVSQDEINKMGLILIRDGIMTDELKRELRLVMIKEAKKEAEKERQVKSGKASFETKGSLANKYLMGDLCWQTDIVDVYGQKNPTLINELKTMLCRCYDDSYVLVDSSELEACKKTINGNDVKCAPCWALNSYITNKEAIIFPKTDEDKKLCPGCNYTVSGSISATCITNEITLITQTGATLNGEIKEEGTKFEVLERGFVWSSSATTPTIDLDNVEYSGPILNDTDNIFTFTLTNLKPSTTYYVQAIIKNESGVNYGGVKEFKTLE